MKKQFYEDILSTKTDVKKLIWTQKNKKSHWFTSNEDLIAFIEKHQSENIFFGVGVTKKKLSKMHRALADDIHSIRGFWNDIDIQGGPDTVHKKDHLPESLEKAIEIANSIIDPTYIVFSGYGIHAYYLFYKHYLIDDFDYWTEFSSQFQRAHAKKYPQYTFDSTFDLARILRCPDSVNCKDLKNKIECKILKYNKDAYYTKEEIEDVIAFDESQTQQSVAEPPAPATVSTKKSAPLKRWSTKQYEKWFKDENLILDKNATIDNDLMFDIAAAEPTLIEEYNHKIDRGDDLSRYDQALANIGVRFGLPNQQVINLLLMHRQKHDAGSKKITRKDYYARTLLQALSKYGANKITQKKNNPTSSDKEILRQYLIDVLGVGISRIIRYDKTPNDQFDLELIDYPNKVIKLGSFAEGIMNQKTFAAKIGAIGAKVPPPLKMITWHRDIIPKLQALTINGKAPLTSTYEGQINIWIKEYFEARNIYTTYQEYYEAQSFQQPFLDNNKAHFSYEDFQSWVRLQKNFILDFGFLTTMISFGFIEVTRETGDKSKINLWASPVNFYIPPKT